MTTCAMAPSARGCRSTSAFACSTITGVAPEAEEAEAHKGISAALLMASLRGSLRGPTLGGRTDLTKLRRNVKALLYEAPADNRYATFFYAQYDPRDRVLAYVNAGHNPPVVLRGEEVLRLEADGPVVGLLAQAQYGQSSLILFAGAIFCWPTWTASAKR